MKRPQASSLLPLALLAASCIFGEKAIQDAASDQDVITTPDMTVSSPDQGEPDADVPDADLPDADLPDDSLPDSGAPDPDMPAVCEMGGVSFGNDCFYPKSCEELAQLHIENNAPPPEDGEHALFVGGEKLSRWRGYCTDMAAAPKTYLSLTAQQAIANTATSWQDPNARMGTTLKYKKIRVMPGPLGAMVDLYDDAFVELINDPSEPKKIYAYTTNCNTMAPTSFNIDLSNTPFKIRTAFDVRGKGELTVDNLPYDLGANRPIEQRKVSVSLRIPDGGGCATAAPALFIRAYQDAPPAAGLHLPLVYEPRGN
jgi:hypothetical protein